MGIDQIRELKENAKLPKKKEKYIIPKKSLDNDGYFICYTINANFNVFGCI